MKQNDRSTPSATPGPARAVEVVTLLGDSVVGVDHLEPARPQPSRRATGALFLAGALLLAVSAMAFTHGVRTAAADRRALEEAEAIDRLAARDLRPTHLGLGWDLLAFGGLGCGVLAFGLGLWRVRSRPQRCEPTGGREAGVPAAVEAVAAGRATELRLAAGPTTYLVRDVPASETRLGGLFAAIDRHAAVFLAASAAVHVIAILLLRTIPPGGRSLALDLGSGEDRPTLLVTLPNVDPEEEPVDDAADLGDDGDGAELAMTGAEGVAGRPDRTEARGANRVKQRAEVESLSRQQAIEQARREGFLGSNLAQELRAFAGNGDFSSGWDKVDSWGFGGGEGDGAGDFGGGRHGDGPGAGGPADDVYRIGNDLWKRPGPGDFGRDGVIRLRDRKPGKPTPVIAMGQPTGPDKEIIRRYIRRHLERIRYLYEKQLLVDPGLQGTVVVVFTISPQGVVLEARGKGLGGHELEDEIAGVIRSIAFPATRDGGAIVVSYPFNLYRRG